MLEFSYMLVSPKKKFIKKKKEYYINCDSDPYVKFFNQ